MLLDLEMENSKIKLNSNSDFISFLKIPNEIKTMKNSCIEKESENTLIYNDAFDYPYIDDSYNDIDRVNVDKAYITLNLKNPYMKPKNMVK